MLTRVNALIRLALWWFFAKLSFGPRLVAAIRDAASRGRVVYVLRQRSGFDQLYFNYAFLEHQLPLARWSNNRPSVFLRPFWSWLRYLFSRKDKRPAAEQLADCVERGDTALVCLSQGWLGHEHDADSTALLERLVELQRGSDTPIILLPLLVVWERRSVESQPSLVDNVFGTRQHPGLLRKLFFFIRNIWQPFFILGAPHVQVCDSVELKTQTNSAKELREALLSIIEKEREVVVGPPVKRAHAIKRELLRDPRFRADIEKLAEQDPRDVDALMRDARRMLDKLSSDYTILAVKLFCAALYPIWNLIYDGLEVDEDGLERIRNAARESRLVFIPSHKSHIDYLIISYLFFRRGLIPPHIVAGDNLNFPPVGALLRRSGAFFIRRQFKGDELYNLVVRAYIAKILEEGHNIEFFIEGGRSRTGKLLPPRFGILRMILDAHLRNPSITLKLVPVSVSYERVIEAGAHQAELMGAKKKQENLGALLRSTQVLTSRYGRLYVSFGECIDVGAQLERQLAQDSSEEALQRFTQSTGRELISAISAAGIVTPSALLGLSLLTHLSRGVGHDRLSATMGYLLNLMRIKGTRLSPTLRNALASQRARLAQLDAAAFEPAQLGFLADPFLADTSFSKDSVHVAAGEAVESLLREAVKLFVDAGMLNVTSMDASPGEQEFFSVPEKERAQLAYYKNTILHVFLYDALLSMALLEKPGSFDQQTLLTRVEELGALLRHEFAIERGDELRRLLEPLIESYVERHWLRRMSATSDDSEPEQVHLQVTAPASALEFFRNMTITFVEAYALVFRELPELEERWMPEPEFIEHAMLACRASYHEGRVRFLESLAKPSFENAVRLLLEEGVLESRSDESRKKPVRHLRLRDGQRGRELLALCRALVRPGHSSQADAA